MRHAASTTNATAKKQHMMERAIDVGPARMASMVVEIYASAPTASLIVDAYIIPAPHRNIVVHVSTIAATKRNETRADQIPLVGNTRIKTGNMEHAMI